MNIVKLTAENVKRLQAVEIKPDGSLVVIGGRNGQGKTSVLDSIMYGLAGGKSLPSMPIRKGEEKASVEIDLGDMVVKRTFTAAGHSSITVTNKDGLKYPSPQSILDNLVGRLTFDPLDFSRQTAKEQSETLRALVGVDVAPFEARRIAAYNERTIVGRDVKSLEARLQSTQRHEGLPSADIAVSEILAEQEKAAKQNADVALLRQVFTTAENQVVNCLSVVERCEQEVHRCQKALNDANYKLDQAFQSHARAKDIFQQRAKDIEGLSDIDLSPFKTRCAEAEAINQKIRQNRQRDELAKELNAKREKVESLTSEIEKADKEKAAAISSAKYPIDGLAFDVDGNVTYNGIPFEQCSSAEQLRVSVAIGLALNPKLRVLLIRDGSLLDSDSMVELQRMADEAKAQVWVERVGNDGAVSVIIDDGMVSGVAIEQSTEQTTGQLL